MDSREHGVNAVLAAGVTVSGPEMGQLVRPFHLTDCSPPPVFRAGALGEVAVTKTIETPMAIMSLGLRP